MASQIGERIDPHEQLGRSPERSARRFRTKALMRNAIGFALQRDARERRRLMSRCSWMAVGLTAWLFFSPYLLAAQTSNVISGLVEDETGAPLPGATITLAGQPPAGPQTTHSQADGTFTLGGVAPGRYTLTVDLSAFESAQQAVTVGAGALPPLRVRLRVARLEQSVTVEAETADDALIAESNTATARLDENLIQELPVAADNLLAVIGNFIAPIGLAAGPSIVVDGVAGGDLDVPSSAINRIRVNRNPYSAAFQYPGSARLEVVTQRGHRSRRLDGGFQTTSRGAVFAARHPFAHSVPDLDRRLVQTHVGGLLRKDASFHVAARRTTTDESAIVNAVTLAGPVVANVPTAQRHDNLLTRLQWWPSGLHTLYLTYGYSDRTARNRGTGGFNLPERGYATGDRKHKVTVTQNLQLPPHWSNTLVGSVATQDERDGAPAAAPAIVVTQAFAAGPAQVFASDRKASLDLQNTTHYYGVRGHALQFGVHLQRTTTDARDQSNFGGTFEFGSLAQLAAGTPLLFRINRGVPQAAFTMYKAHGFLQDEMTVTRDLTVTLGLRYDWQSTVGDRTNLAPRVGVAWVPPAGRKKTVVRGGAGVFYDDLPRAATERALLFDGVRLRETVIANPSYPDPFGSGQIVTPPPSTVRLAPDLHTPYMTQVGAGLEQEVWGRNQLAAEYVVSRGENQFRSRNLNAPVPGTGRRPDQAFLNINQVESNGEARSQALTVSWRGRVGKAFRPYVQYVLAKTTNDTAGLFSLPADNFALAAESGPADFDQRHRLNLIGTLALPGAVQTGLVLSMGSGLPYDITTGFDDNGDTLANDRPRGITRNTGRGPSTVQLDVRITKTLARSRRGDQGQKRDGLDVMVDVFNALNRTNVTGIAGAVSSPFFGRANAAAAARTVQFSVRYSFRR
jgi:Carboxypeptidase regulatory-like domain/TonB dependent receptor